MTPITSTKRKEILSLVILLACAVFLYLFNIDGWYMQGDEGTDLYEAWRLQQGKVPGTDYVAEQQPLYLMAGAFLIDLFGREVLALRLLSAVQIMAGAFILSLVIRRLFGFRVAAFSLVFILVSGVVYEYARLYRPDGMMFAWEMAGLAIALLAVTEPKLRWWVFAGICYGIAFLLKPFGAFPVFGLTLFFLDWLIRERHQPKRALTSGFAFAVPFVFISGGISAVLYSHFGFYYAEIFRQHSQVSRGEGILRQLLLPLKAYGLFFLTNLSFLLIVPLWILNRPKKVLSRPEMRLLLWQLPSVAILVFLTRPFYQRYLIYLVPVFAILLAWQIDLMLKRLAEQGEPMKVITPVVFVVFVVFSAYISIPRLPVYIALVESQTKALAGFVADNTKPGDVVLSDYAIINFLADRPSIPEASIIAGGRIESGIVTGDMLIGRLQEENASMVLLHVDGGIPPANQLVKLIDFREFSAFLKKEFSLVTTFDRNGQKIEIYHRKV